MVSFINLVETIRIYDDFFVNNKVLYYFIDHACIFSLASPPISFLFLITPQAERKKKGDVQLRKATKVHVLSLIF